MPWWPTGWWCALAIVLTVAEGGVVAAQVPGVPLPPTPTLPVLPLPPPVPAPLPAPALPPAPVPAPLPAPLPVPAPELPAAPPAPAAPLPAAPLPDAPQSVPSLPPAGGLPPPADGLIPPIGEIGPDVEPAPSDQDQAAPSEQGRQRRGESREPDTPEPRIKPTLRFVALLTLGAEYRHNVLFEPDGEGDTAGVLTPELHLRYRTRRITWNTAYRRIAEAYLRETSLTTSNRWQGADTALQARLTPRLGTTLSAAWRDIHDPTFEILAGATTPTSTRVAYRQWGLNNAWNARLTHVVEGHAAYRYVNVSFSNQGVISREEHQAEVGARVRVTAQDALLPRYRLHRFVPETGAEIRVHTLAGAYERALTRTILARVRAGLAWLDGPDAPETGYTTAVESEWRRDVLTARASYERDFAAVNGVEGVFLTHAVSMAAARRVSRAVDAGVSAHYRWQEDVRSVPVRVLYQTWSSQVDVTAKTADWLLWRVTSSFVRQSTRAAPFDDVVVRHVRLMLSATLVATGTIW